MDDVLSILTTIDQRGAFTEVLEPRDALEVASALVDNADLYHFSTEAIKNANGDPLMWCEFLDDAGTLIRLITSEDILNAAFAS